jgi:hypothetical protein
MRPVLLALAILVLAAPAQARSLRLVDDGPAAAASADGRFVAWTRSGAPGTGVRVRDTRTWRLRTVDTPPGCTFAAVSAGSLLWNCGSFEPSGRVVDLRTGAVSALPVLRSLEDGEFGSQGRYVSIGRRWAGIVRAGYHYAGPVFAPRAGGPERAAARAPDLVADLDVPGLFRRLCAPVRRPEVADGSGLGTTLAPELRQIGGASVSTVTTDSPSPDTRVILQRCGHAARTLRRCPPQTCNTDEQPALTRGTAAWVETRGDPGSTLRLVTLRTHRTRLVELAKDGVLVGAAGGRVFVMSGRHLRHVTL